MNEQETGSSHSEAPLWRDAEGMFANTDYQFRMGVKKGEMKDFFRTPSFDVLQERATLLEPSDSPHPYLAMTYAGEKLLDEAVSIAEMQGALDRESADRVIWAGEAMDRAAQLGREWEADFLLMDRQRDDSFLLAGGCVCFPSSWDVRDKIGRRLHEIHGVVPGLNEQMQRRISGYIAGLKPGQTWLLSNWGLAATSERNLHPDLGRPRLTKETPIEQIYVRVEEQSFTALPETRGLLFGIRLDIRPVIDVMHHPEIAAGLRRKLLTMPEPMAAYKGIHTVRHRLAEALGTAAAH